MRTFFLAHGLRFLPYSVFWWSCCPLAMCCFFSFSQLLLLFSFQTSGFLVPSARGEKKFVWAFPMLSTCSQFAWKLDWAWIKGSYAWGRNFTSAAPNCVKNYSRSILNSALEYRALKRGELSRIA